MLPPSNTDPAMRRNYAGPSAARASSAFPEDVRAVIEREPRPAPQCVPTRRRGWRLRFLRRLPRDVDPLTGWTTGADPLAHVRLRFPDLPSAIRYAERHDLPYEIRDEPQDRAPVSKAAGLERQAGVQLCCWPTGPHALCCGNYPLNTGPEAREITTEARA